MRWDSFENSQFSYKDYCENLTSMKTSQSGLVIEFCAVTFLSILVDSLYLGDLKSGWENVRH